MTLERITERVSRAGYINDAATPRPFNSLSGETKQGRRARLESLRLSQIHTKERLKRATNPAYREMLERALRHLEAEMLD